MAHLVHPNGALEWRYVPLDWMRIGQARILDFEVEAKTAHASVTVAATSPARLWISDDAGASFTELGIDVVNGFALGSFTPNERKPIKIKALVPTGPSREELVGLEFGVGT